MALNTYKSILCDHIISYSYFISFFFFTENRHLTDTQFRLSDNSNTQRQLNEAAFHAEMDLKAKQIEQKLEVGEIDIIHLIIHVISVQCDLSQVSAVIIHSSCKFR